MSTKEENPTVYLNVRTDRYHTSEDCAGTGMLIEGEFKVMRHGSMACNNCSARSVEKAHEHI